MESTGIAIDHRWTRPSGTRVFVPALVLGFLALATPRSASAHQDPNQCNSTGVAITVETFRADRQTPLPVAIPASECETISYRVILAKPDEPNVCAFEQGTLTLTTADGVEHDLTPTDSGGQSLIPCLGGTTNDPGLTPPTGECAPALRGFVSGFVDYRLRPQDAAAGTVIAVARYRNGLLHINPDNLPDAARGTVPIPVRSAPCPSGTDCREGICDPNLCNNGACNGESVRRGVCTSRNFPFSTPCEADAEECTFDHCDGNGNCVFLGRNPDLLCDSNHYKCYRTRTAPIAERTVELTDQFGTSTAARVIRASRFCNPANKNGEGIVDPTAHLMCYEIRDQRFTRREVIVTNQFGEQRLTVLRPEGLCNPAAKDLVPRETEINHFKCYRVSGRGFITRTVGVSDQFETSNDTLVKPRLLCNPVDKNGEGMVDPFTHLTCYTIKHRAGFTPREISVEDQFTEQDLTSLRGQCSRRGVLCVPSQKRHASPSGAFIEASDDALL